MNSEHRQADGDISSAPVRDWPAPPSILIVIVNYKTADLTIDCLRSLEPELASNQRGRARVIVTDNASPDDSVKRLEAAVRDNGWSDWIEVQPLERNGGFAYGNNAAIRPALASETPPDYVWLLNPDTIVLPGAMGALIEFMEANPEIGIAGSRLEGLDGELQRSAFRFPSVLGEVEDGLRFGPASRILSRWIVAPPPSATPTRCDWVAGASMIVRRAVFEDIGLMDEGYFMYFEEVDFCCRANRAGHSCWYVPTSRVVHLVGQSSGVTDARQSRKRRPSYWFEARHRYFRSNLGRTKTLLANLGWSLGFSLFRARQKLQRKRDDCPERLLRDFVSHNFFRASHP